MDERNRYIDVYFGTGQCISTTSEVWQYDHGLKLRIHGFASDNVPQIHYSNTGLTNAMNVVSTRESNCIVADIPDILLTQPKEIQCYAYVENSSSGVTVYEIHIPVRPRSKPNDLSFTPQQIDSYGKLVSNLNTAIDEVEDMKSDLDAATNKANTAAGIANTEASGANAAKNAANAAVEKINNMTVSATGLAVGKAPTATISETGGRKHITFGIPKGNTGATPNLTIGTVKTGAPGTDAAATFTGTAEAPILNLTIPEGRRGVTDGVPLSDATPKPSTSTGSAGSSNEVSRDDHNHPYPRALKDPGTKVMLDLMKDPNAIPEGINVRFMGFNNESGEPDTDIWRTLTVLRDNRVRLWDPESRKSYQFYTTLNKPEQIKQADKEAGLSVIVDPGESESYKAINILVKGFLNDAGEHDLSKIRSLIITEDNHFSLYDSEAKKSYRIYTALDEPPYPVTSVNGKTGAVAIKEMALSDALPKVSASTASAGTSEEAARVDHRHAYPSTIKNGQDSLTIVGLSKGEGDAKERVYVSLKGFTNSDGAVDSSRYKALSFYKNDNIVLWDSETKKSSTVYTTTFKPTMIENSDGSSLSIKKDPNASYDGVMLDIRGYTNESGSGDARRSLIVRSDNLVTLWDAENKKSYQFYTTLNKPTAEEINAVAFTAQTLTDAQKEQARKNIGALSSGSTVANSGKLGGKAPQYYIQPVNLLDNSDFANPINQRGLTEWNNVESANTVDRWKIWKDNLETVSAKLTSDGMQIIRSLYQNITISPDKTYTFAAMVDGTLLVCSGIPAQKPSKGIIGMLKNEKGFTQVWINPRLGDGETKTVQWAALYEGKYTADSLPPYRPKGYAVELAECQRYYQIRSTNNVPAVDMRPLMRISNPTVTAVTGGYAYSADI